MNDIAYNGIMNDARADLNEARRRLAHVHKLDWTWLPPIPGSEKGFWYSGLAHEANVIMPFDRNLMEDIKKALFEQGWVMVQETTERDVATTFSNHPNQLWQKDGHQLYVVYSDYQPGSTCQRRPIGKVTQAVDLYEFSCTPIPD